MNHETAARMLVNAGFIVDFFYPYIIVSLKNRPISTIEVALILGVEPASLLISNGTVLVTC